MASRNVQRQVTNRPGVL